LRSRPRGWPTTRCAPYAPDVFIKDKVEALAQQLGLELPHQEQWDFIQSAESLDSQAAPGSGKTSLIGLKLALLGQGWTSPTRGICALSHTNTAKDGITNRLAVTPAGRLLLQYPHFIGTIQSFANTFFALPALQACGIESRPSTTTPTPTGPVRKGSRGAIASTTRHLRQPAERPFPGRAEDLPAGSW
jgi:hypothetical protein